MHSYFCLVSGQVFQWASPTRAVPDGTCLAQCLWQWHAGHPSSETAAAPQNSNIVVYIQHTCVCSTTYCRVRAAADTNGRGHVAASGPLQGCSKPQDSRP